ncbi:MAG: lysophospholipid acyltransferase family protein [Candidatus Paceibacterota bacterium]|jgi:1-acyl-sn-glycerol-3-phosphate acyltransferase
MATTLDGTVGTFDIVGNRSHAQREKIINNFVKISQYITWPVLYVIFHILFRVTISGRENFQKVQRPFIIISNHISYYDSFLYRLILGLRTPHLPLRFMAVTKFDWRFLNILESIGIIEFIYSLFGVFTIVPGLGLNKNIAHAIEIIESGGNVVIYPEGQIHVPDGSGKAIGPFKKGASVLTQMTGAPVIPVSFRVTHHWFRKRIKINVGSPIASLSNQRVEDITKSFYDSVEALHARV